MRSGGLNLKIGTVLVRDYHGRRHTVTVGPDGFVWEGASYSSLSAIARAITGTVWSGPRFFAIRPQTTTPTAHGRRARPAETRPLPGRVSPRAGNPQFSEEANHDRSGRKTPALRRLHPQVDRA
jgi:hypothetical protein